jgi:hypothetical protein
MTMRHSLGLLALSAAFLACSGRYYEVGGNDGAAGTGATGSGATAGDAPNAIAGTQAVGATGSGGTMSAGEGMPAGEFGPQCVPSGAPPQLAGQFAEPAVVWNRIARLTWGKEVAPLYGLPETTTYTWAGDAARAALVSAKETLGSVPGVEKFLHQWLALPATSSFQYAWGESLETTSLILSELLLTPLGDEGRVGIFTEPSWLAEHKTISSRGLNVENSLFNTAIPPPPEGLDNPQPNTDLSDRDWLAAATSPPPCNACHQLLDQSGFALGRFAGDGTYRELDHGSPIDTTGSRRVGMVGERKFDGIEDFGRQFAGSCEATLGFADQFLLAAMAINGVPEEQRYTLFEANRARMEQAFVHGGRTYEAAVKAYIQSPAGLRP